MLPHIPLPAPRWKWIAHRPWQIQDPRAPVPASKWRLGLQKAFMKPSMLQFHVYTATLSFAARHHIYLESSFCSCYCKLLSTQQGYSLSIVSRLCCKNIHTGSQQVWQNLIVSMQRGLDRHHHLSDRRCCPEYLVYANQGIRTLRFALWSYCCTFELQHQP